MCGRYVSATPPDELAKYFGALAPSPEHALSPNHNGAHLIERADPLDAPVRLSSVRRAGPGAA